MIYFLSDVHLGYYERAKDKDLETRFIKCLQNIKNDCDSLILLGDIFDYWFEYRRVIPAFYYRTLAELADISNLGIQVEYLMGNHDFGHRSFFENELGIKIIKEDIERIYNGKRFYLSHGDGKSYNDNGYLMLRKILRNTTCQKLYSMLHPDIGIKLALNSSRTSRQYTGGKKYGETDGMHDFAKQKICEGYDYVIMGHRHIVERTEYNENGHKGEYINLGCWLKDAHIGRFDGSNFELIKIE
jgi:UDP-2,3-diacylglucosamine hydrolase